MKGAGSFGGWCDSMAWLETIGNQSAEADAVSPVTLQQAVTNRLRELLLLGTLQAGTRLQEVTLAKSLGVSRTPLRAALTILSQEGLVSYVPNCGYEVRNLTLDDILETYDVRGTMEGLACRLVAERGIDEVSRGVLSECLKSGQKIVRQVLPEEQAAIDWQQMNSCFHETILKAAGNHCLVELTRRTLSFPSVTRWIARWHDVSQYSRPQFMHEALFDAIVNQESSRAESLMREHVHQAKSTVRKVLLEHLDEEDCLDVRAVWARRRGWIQEGSISKGTPTKARRPKPPR